MLFAIRRNPSADMMLLATVWFIDATLVAQGVLCWYFLDSVLSPYNFSHFVAIHRKAVLPVFPIYGVRHRSVLVR